MVTKTPEQLAQKYANENCGGECPDDEPGVIAAFLAGYKAAKDQLFEETGFRLKLFKDQDEARAAYEEALQEDEADKAYQLGLRDGAPQWISVEDRLPSYDELNLLWHKDFKQQFVGRRRDSGVIDPLYYWECSQDFFEAWKTSTFPKACSQEEITHWMPLPKSPEEA